MCAWVPSFVWVCLRAYACVCVCLATGTAIKIPLPHCNCKTSLRLICCVNSVTFRHLRMFVCMCVCLYVYAFLPATGECNFSHTGLGLPYFHSFPVPRFRFLVVFLPIPIILAWRHRLACMSALYAVYLSTPAHCCPINCCTCVRVTSISDRCLLSRPMAKAVALACFLLVAYYYFYFLLASSKLLTLTRTPTLSKLAGFFSHIGRSVSHTCVP